MQISLALLSLAGVSTLALGSVALVAFGMPQLGSRSCGSRLERIQASPNFSDGKVVNIIPTDMGMNSDFGSTAWKYVTNKEEVVPSEPIPTVRPEGLEQAKQELHVTWFGHSTVLLELDGRRFLTDPVFSDRASPFKFMGPKRFYPPPLLLEELPPLDAVLISHDHYDHLDYETVLRLAESGVPFVVPLGVGAHLEKWGIATDQIVELDWWEETEIGGVWLVCTPARHFSGRGLADRNTTLWSSWAILGSEQRAWYSGDTGVFPQVSEIGERLGPFDLAMIEIGAFDPAWSMIHAGPDGAADLFQKLGAKTLMPIHWGTFNLALHAWDQPNVRLQELAEEQDFALLAPLAGERVNPKEPSVAEYWRGRR